MPALLWHTATPDKWKDILQSRYEAKSDPILNVLAQASAIMECLKPDLGSPLFSPMLNPSFKELAPAYIQVAGLDPVLDEGILYEQELRKWGVTTKLGYYGGVPHMFHCNWPEMLVARKYVQDTLEGVRWLLEVGRKR